MDSSEVRVVEIIPRLDKPFGNCFVFIIRDLIMNILRMVKTMIAARGLEVLLLGREVTLPDGVSLRVVVSIKKELSQDKIWMVVYNQGRGRIIPIEQIASVTNKVILFTDLSLSGMAMNGDSPSPNLSLEGRGMG